MNNVLKKLFINKEEALRMLCVCVCGHTYENCECGGDCEERSAMSALDTRPMAQWKPHGEGCEYDGDHCTNCGALAWYHSNFCQNCGAIMENGGQKD